MNIASSGEPITHAQTLGPVDNQPFGPKAWLSEFEAVGGAHAECGRHDIEPLGYVLANLMECAAAAGASLVLDIDDLFDPFEVRGERPTVGFAGTLIALTPAAGIDGGFGAAQRCLDVLERELELIVIELLGTPFPTAALHWRCELLGGAGASGAIVFLHFADDFFD